MYLNNGLGKCYKWCFENKDKNIGILLKIKKQNSKEPRWIFCKIIEWLEL
ncbi:hypothetical protein LEP1GSC019_0019, partial [Leptospira interrogans serovar Pyrogenes str. 2006006960]